MRMGVTLRRVVKASWKIVALVLVAGVVVYFVRFKPVAVDAFEVKVATVEAEVLGTGALEARIKVTVSSKITGKIAALKVDQNDNVSENQLLATLDDGELHQQVEMAAATLEATKASLVRAQADIARAEAVLTQAMMDHERVKRLFDSKMAAADEMSRSRERLDIAVAEMGRGKAAKTEIEHQVSASQQTLKYHQERLADTRLASPFGNGLVLVRYREVGDVVVPGTAIMDLACLNEMWVSAWVDESASVSLAVGQTARVVFRSEPEKSYSGQVARLAKQTDRETREFLVDVQVKDLPKNWSVGQRAEVHIQTARKDGVLAIPQRMIVWKDGKPHVFVREAGRARLQKVDLGLRGRDNVEVVSGLRLGQVVVQALDGDGNPLRDGAFVK
ncbi:MAG: Macrolide export protein MacA [Phycisphaerae bacterium]|nr:Macrolide export protein MacA [Phycisphaerae bacterium]